MTERLVLGAPQWFWPAVVTWLAISAWIVYTAIHAPNRSSWLALAAVLKIVGVGLLLSILLEPMVSGEKARPQANYFAVLADNSQSMKIESVANPTPQPIWSSLLDEEQDWLKRLSQDFRLRRYRFDHQLQAVDHFSELDWQGSASRIEQSLTDLRARYIDRPLAGVLLFSDGNATDRSGEISKWKDVGVPVYPVLLRGEEALRDINLLRLTVSQTDFEASPVTLDVQLTSSGLLGREARLLLLDAASQEVAAVTIKLGSDGELVNHRFRFRPAKSGVQGYLVKVRLMNELAIEPGGSSSEMTLLNNQRFAVVDRGIGPYRILYLAGRPNWEHKFLRRALDADEEVKLVSLLRIAKKEPKFSFRDSRVESSNQLFSGFEDVPDDEKEAYDEPVMIRLGVEQSEQLSDGFPKSAEELFGYQAIILDDIEHEFFSQEQLLLLRQFVSVRGGGLMMLGGQETFRGDSLRKSALGELLPVYPESKKQAAEAGTTDEGVSRWGLTREGWLQPWLRLAETEDAERTLISERTPLRVVNRIEGIKPGASLLAESKDSTGVAVPLMAAQKFGKGKTAALMAGDLWRWAMHRNDENTDAPLMAAWRQTVRWLIADVPKRVQVNVVRMGTSEGSQVELMRDQANANATRLRATILDTEYKPLDNVKVSFNVTLPSKKVVLLQGEPSTELPGCYETSLVSKEEGVFRVEVVALAEDGSEVGKAETGWVAEPSAEEFEELKADRELLAELARATGGELIDKNRLDSFVSSLPERSVPVKEKYVYPVWHEPWVVLLAIGCLCAEWGLRRKMGLA